MTQIRQSNFVAYFQDWFLNTTDAPVLFSEAAAIMCLSTIALGRRWYNTTSGLHPNLYMMIIGPSTMARKTTTVRRAAAIIDELCPDRKGPTDYTPEALFKFMGGKAEETGKGRNKLVLFHEEFAADLARAFAYKNSLRDDLTNLYDGHDVNKVRAGFGKDVFVSQPRVSLMAAITYKGLEDNTKKVDWTTGFLQRFLYVAPEDWRETQPKEGEPDLHKQNTALNKLYAIQEAIRHPNSGAMYFDAEADAYYIHEYNRLEASFKAAKAAKTADVHEEAPQEIYAGRFWPNIKKIALLHQLDIDPTTPLICTEALSRAFQFCKPCWTGYQRAYIESTRSDFGTLCHLVQEVLKKNRSVPLAQLTSIFGFNAQLMNVVKYFETQDLVQRVNQNGRIMLVSKV